MTPANVVDIILVATLALGLIIGFARGLMRTLLSIVIFVAAFLGSTWVANTFAQPVTDWVMPYVKEFVMQQFGESMLVPQTASLGGELLGGELMGGLGGMVQEMINSLLTTGITTLENAIGSIIHTMAFIIIFLLSMLVLTLLLRLITVPLRLVERVPVLGFANRLGGAALGLVLSVLICFVITAVVKMTGVIDPNHTYLYSFFAANTPQSLLALFR